MDSLSFFFVLNKIKKITRWTGFFNIFTAFAKKSCQKANIAHGFNRGETELKILKTILMVKKNEIIHGKNRE
jgi:hypothetical protein